MIGSGACGRIVGFRRELITLVAPGPVRAQEDPGPGQAVYNVRSPPLGVPREESG